MVKTSRMLSLIGLPTVVLNLLLLLKSTNGMTIQADNLPTAKPVITTAATKPIIPIITTTKLRTSTVSASTSTKVITTIPTTIPAPTPDSLGCWLRDDRSSPNVCHSCNICRSELSPGIIAGIVIAVIVIYIVSLILTALLASHYTKKGTLDFDKMIFSRISILKRKKDEAHLASIPHEENVYQENQTSEIYTALQRSNPSQSLSDSQMYTTLKDVGRGNRTDADSGSEQATNDSETTELQAESEPQMVGTPKSRSRNREGSNDATKTSATGPSIEKKKPKIKQKPQKTKNVKEDDIYQNSYIANTKI